MGIYVGNKRYGLCMGKGNLINTVALAESHESDALGNPYYWSNFLELPLVSDSSDNNVYFVIFEGNHASPVSYRIDFAVYCRVSDKIIRCVSSRNDVGNVMIAYDTSRSLYASAGTVISVYKIPSI